MIGSASEVSLAIAGRPIVDADQGDPWCECEQPPECRSRLDPDHGEQHQPDEAEQTLNGQLNAVPLEPPRARQSAARDKEECVTSESDAEGSNQLRLTTEQLQGGAPEDEREGDDHYAQ